MVVMWIKILVAKGQRPFIENFHYEFFFDGIQMMLGLSDLFSCYKCLWMLNETMEYLPSTRCSLTSIIGKRKAELITRLLEDNFYTLFFHWSHYYRHLFQMIYLYRVRFWTMIKYLHKINWE
jgi:hypothetical protein